MKKFCAINQRRFSALNAGLAALIIFCALWPGNASAHRVNVFAWVEGDTIHSQSKFSGGRRVKEGVVVVYDLGGNELLTGKTDDRGEFSFKMPRRVGMKMTVQAGTGHRGEWTILADEIGDISGVKAEPAAPVQTVSEKPAGRAGVSGVDRDEIRRIVEQTLDRKLKPVMDLLVETRDTGPSLRDILGGTGYLLGLMGLAAYLHFRRKSAELETEKKD